MDLDPAMFDPPLCIFCRREKTSNSESVPGVGFRIWFTCDHCPTQPCDVCGKPVTVNAVSPSECFCSDVCLDKHYGEEG